MSYPDGEIGGIEWARLCPPGVPMGATKAEKVPRPPSGHPKDVPGDFPDIGTAPRSDRVQEPENDQYGDDGFHIPPMGQKCESGKAQGRRSPEGGAKQGLGRSPFPLVLCLAQA